MSVRLSLMAGFAVLVAVSSFARAQVISEKNFDKNWAVVFAERSGSEGSRGFWVACWVRAGGLGFFLGGDGASPHNLGPARRKAYTALTFRRTSADWAKRTAEGDVAGQRNLTDVIPLGGGVPIMIGDDAIGSVGLSGAPGGQTQEDACAKAGIAQVQDQLK